MYVRCWPPSYRTTEWQREVAQAVGVLHGCAGPGSVPKIYLHPSNLGSAVNLWSCFERSPLAVFEDDMSSVRSGSGSLQSRPDMTADNVRGCQAPTWPGALYMIVRSSLEVSRQVSGLETHPHAKLQARNGHQEMV